MDYFESLGSISYRGELVTNLLQPLRIDILSESVRKEKKYRSYTLMDGETPEMVSKKLYGTKRFWWLVLLVNGQYSSWWSFPISQSAIYDSLISSGKDPNSIVAYQDLVSNEYVDRYTFDKLVAGEIELENNFLPITLVEKLYKEQDEKRTITVLDASQLQNFLSVLLTHRNRNRV